MARQHVTRSPARLVVALAVAGVLAVFLLYTALHGSTPLLQPSNLNGHPGTVSLTGKVVGPVLGDSHSTSGMRFSLHNINGASPLVAVVYRGDVPDLFKAGRDVNLTGRLANGSFVSSQMTTKCPSKYTASPSKD
ncbi:MAG: cytochrome c maturation protein CcmE [Actinobacteria bacterium]|nr:cytochrome c maturation protein CcmE [Actinomycetota bacterium]MBV8396366.1 cytochrome c maturation protein CcmE [Actinomycetota bacterium]